MFWQPVLTFDLIYLENYHYAFSSNIIFLILLFKLNKMICDKAMFGPQTTKLLHWPWSDHCYPIKVTGAVTIRSGEASSNDFSILMTYTSLLVKFHNLFTFWTIEAHWHRTIYVEAFDLAWIWCHDPCWVCFLGESACGHRGVLSCRGQSASDQV